MFEVFTVVLYIAMYREPVGPGGAGAGAATLHTQHDGRTRRIG